MKKTLETIKKLSFFSTFIAVGITILASHSILLSLPIPLTVKLIILYVVIAIGLILIIYALVRDIRTLLKNREWSEKKWSLPSIYSFLFLIVWLTVLVVLPTPTTLTSFAERFSVFSNPRLIVFSFTSLIGLFLAIYGIQDASRNGKKGELIASIIAVFFGIFTSAFLLVFIFSILPTELVKEISQLLEKVVR